MKTIWKQALKGLIQLQVLMAVMIFVPAGSPSFWQGWLYWIVFGVTTTAITIYFLKHDPALIERRLRAGPRAETETSQKIIQAIAGASFVAMMVVPGLGYRFGWSTVPAWVAVVGDVFVVIGLMAVFLVFRENSFAASTIKVETEQRVITTGLYGYVRHPMYAGASIMIVATPLALGSLWAEAVALALCAVVAVRSVYEERLLAVELRGYEEYRRKVRYRMIPMVW